MGKKRKIAAILSAVLVLGICPAAQVRAENAEDCAATVYSENSFCGTKQHLEVGRYDIDDLLVGNDTISSVRVSKGYQVTLYKDGGFSGDTEVTTVNKRWISLDNEVSGVVVEYVGEPLPVIAYVDAEWSGNAQEFDLGEYDWAEINAGVGNDEISSLRIAPGYQVTLYADANFKGSTLVLTEDVINLKDFSFNDKASSLKIEAINPLDDTCMEIMEFDDETMAELLREFAPRIWMAEGESYFASSIDWALDSLERYYDAAEGKYCLRTKETLSSPTQKLPFFYGNQESARCYAFWTEKDYNNIDLSFWQYCPYNYGKKVVGTEFGNHIGDWEHVTVRLNKFTYEGRTYVKPTFVALPYHSYINIYRWDEMDKVEGTNHVIAYCAKESHGMWKDAGNHVYLNIVITKLTDECSAGTAMDCWTILETYEFLPDALTGRGIKDTEWTSYFDCDYDNPDSSSVARWGNEGEGSAFGQPILASGPAGPEGHDALYDRSILR